jgi:hypothetical protein
MESSKQENLTIASLRGAGDRGRCRIIYRMEYCAGNSERPQPCHNRSPEIASGCETHPRGASVCQNAVLHPESERNGCTRILYCTIYSRIRCSGTEAIARRGGLRRGWWASEVTVNQRIRELPTSTRPSGCTRSVAFQ